MTTTAATLDIDAAARSAVHALLWAASEPEFETDEELNAYVPLDHRLEDIDPAEVERIREMIAAFVAAHPVGVTMVTADPGYGSGDVSDSFGHDWALTTVGAGVGFWDRLNRYRPTTDLERARGFGSNWPTPDAGKVLSDLVPRRDLNPYEGEDGVIRFDF